jgi:hypothetical protein
LIFLDRFVFGRFFFENIEKKKNWPFTSLQEDTGFGGKRGETIGGNQYALNAN